MQLTEQLSQVESSHNTYATSCTRRDSTTDFCKAHVAYPRDTWWHRFIASQPRSRREGLGFRV